MTKTKRGSYYYISVGDSYYAGTRPVMASKTVVVDREWTEDEKKKPRYRRAVNRGYGHYRVPTKKGKHDTWRYGYYETRIAKPGEKIKVDVPSGKYVEDWTTDFTKAKKFRIESKALAKATELAKSNSMDKIKPKVTLFEGDR